MTKYAFFKAEERQYSLGKDIDLVRARMIAHDLAEKTKEISRTKIHEAIGFGWYNKIPDNSPSITDHEISLTFALFRGNLTVKTELLYIHENGSLMVAQQTVDEHDEYLPRPISMFDLATFTKAKETSKSDERVFEREVFLNIHPLQQIGVDPKFLYDFGDKYGRRL